VVEPDDLEERSVSDVENKLPWQRSWTWPDGHRLEPYGSGDFVPVCPKHGTGDWVPQTVGLLALGGSAFTCTLCEAQIQHNLLSDTTTPKRNEAVDRFGCSDEYASPDPAGDYVLHTDYAALQGEVSRLRERASECEKVLAIVLGGMLSGAVKSKPLMSREGSDYTVGSLQELIEITLMNSNLEPPTDGR
jgi:hypothetical protein